MGVPVADAHRGPQDPEVVEYVRPAGRSLRGGGQGDVGPDGRDVPLRELPVRHGLYPAEDGGGPDGAGPPPHQGYQPSHTGGVHARVVLPLPVDDLVEIDPGEHQAFHAAPKASGLLYCSVRTPGSVYIRRMPWSIRRTSGGARSSERHVHGAAHRVPYH